MFVKFNRINTRNEVKEVVANVEDISYVTERHVDKVDLIQNGTKVGEQDGEKRFDVKMKSGIAHIVDQANYDIVVKALLK